MSQLLAPYGLARCSNCSRILLSQRLHKARCRDKAECAASAMMATAMEGDRSDRFSFSLGFVVGLEKALWSE